MPQSDPTASTPPGETSPPSSRSSAVLAPLLALAGPCLRGFLGTAFACGALGLLVAGGGTYVLSRADAEALHVTESWRLPVLAVSFVLLALGFGACGVVFAFARAVGGTLEAAVRRHSLARRAVDGVASRIAGEAGRRSIAEAERSLERGVAAWLSDEAQASRGLIARSSSWVLRRALVRPVEAVMRRALRAEAGEVDAPRVFAVLGLKAEDLVCKAIRAKTRAVTMLAIAGMVVVAAVPFVVAFAPRE